MSERIYIKNILDALNPIKFQCPCLIVSIKYEGQVNLSVIYTDNTFPRHKYFFPDIVRILAILSVNTYI